MITPQFSTWTMSLYTFWFFEFLNKYFKTISSIFLRICVLFKKFRVDVQTFEFFFLMGKSLPSHCTYTCFIQRVIFSSEHREVAFRRLSGCIRCSPDNHPPSELPMKAPNSNNMKSVAVAAIAVELAKATVITFVAISAVAVLPNCGHSCHRNIYVYTTD